MRKILVLTCLLLLGGTSDADDGETLANAATGKLRPLLADRDRGVRYAAAMALGKAGEFDALAPVLDDSEWCVRAEARWWKAGGAKPALLPPHVPARFPPPQRRAPAPVTPVAAGLIDPL